MGGSVSNGRNNNELADNLVESGYIRTKIVEKVFRAVDRANYILPEYRDSAYRDLAWKYGNIHLSAPCIYSEVMEGLSLKPGLSFLNLGSGTGYFSTMVGLILGQTGTNHGIELQEDCIKYSYKRLEKFKQKSLAIDEFDFCEPVFIQGNCLNIIPGRLYDRVYCGAACPENHETFVKQLIRIGGILVMPFEDHLFRIERIGEDKWVQEALLPVSFTTLVVPDPVEQNSLHLPESNPLLLQEICRSTIRCRLRQNVWLEHPDLETEKKIILHLKKAGPHERILRHLVIPMFEGLREENNESEGDEYRARLLINVNTEPGEEMTSLELVRGGTDNEVNENCQNNQRGSHNVIQFDSNFNFNSGAVEMDGYNDESDEDLQNNQRGSDISNHLDVNLDSGNDKDPSLSEQPQDIEINESVENNSNSSCDQAENQSQQPNDVNVDKVGDKSNSEISSSESESDSDSEKEIKRKVTLQRGKMEKREKTDSGIVEDLNTMNDDGSSGSVMSLSESDDDDDDTDDDDDGDNNEDNVLYEYDYDDDDDDDFEDEMDVDSFPFGEPRVPMNPQKYWNDETVVCYTNRIALSSYMKEKISQLPLPLPLKLYVNYNRNL